MIVKRIVANVAVSNPAEADAFYQELFGLDLLMDQGWIRTYRSTHSTLKGQAQISFVASDQGGTAIPDLSIEVDDLEIALQRANAAGVSIEYGPTAEPWGVTRFFIRDPLWDTA